LTTTPHGLLKEFKKAIDDGHIATWGYDSDGDFTHTAAQWKNLAWFRASPGSDRLLFNIMRPQDGKVSAEVYAIYHGRLIEALLAHFDKDFTNGMATASATSDDLV